MCVCMRACACLCMYMCVCMRAQKRSYGGASFSDIDEDGYNIVCACGEQKVLYLCAFRAVPVYAVSNPNCHENASWAPSVL